MSDSSPQNRSLRILLVEDESLLAMTLEDILEDLGHRLVGVASRIAKALHLARTAELDFAILDVNIDGQLSYPVAEILRARGIPFVFTTGYGAQGIDPGFRDAPVLAKPFTRAEIMQALERAATS
jgi:CheY-like chemotaxis protein